jgi:hypothetical protein
MSSFALHEGRALYWLREVEDSCRHAPIPTMCAPVWF